MMWSTNAFKRSSLVPSYYTFKILPKHKILLQFLLIFNVPVVTISLLSFNKDHIFQKNKTRVQNLYEYKFFTQTYAKKWNMSTTREPLPLKRKFNRFIGSYASFLWNCRQICTRLTEIVENSSQNIIQKFQLNLFYRS